MKLKVLATAAALFFSGAAQADVITVGPTGAGGDCTFACMVQFQQAYDSASFSGPMNIGSVSFFSRHTHSMNATYDMYIGYMDGDYTSISTSDLASNRGDGYTAFGSLTLTGTFNSGDVTTFTGSFDYDPAAGDLLIEIFRSAETGSNNGNFAAASGLPLSRAYQWPHGSQSGGVGYGITTQFGTSDIVASVPTPGALALLGLGLIGVGVRRRAV